MNTEELKNQTVNTVSDRRQSLPIKPYRTNRLSEFSLATVGAKKKTAKRNGKMGVSPSADGNKGYAP